MVSAPLGKVSSNFNSSGEYISKNASFYVCCGLNIHSCQSEKIQIFTHDFSVRDNYLQLPRTVLTRELESSLYLRVSDTNSNMISLDHHSNSFLLGLPFHVPNPLCTILLVVWVTSSNYNTLEPGLQ